jgi:hypothetical protein
VQVEPGKAVTLDTKFNLTVQTRTVDVNAASPDIDLVQSMLQGQITYRDFEDADDPTPSAPRTFQPLKGEQPMNTNTATEYRNLPLAVLTESATNPRRIFEDSALKEKAESIRSQGVLNYQSFEIISGA